LFFLPWNSLQLSKQQRECGTSLAQMCKQWQP
jgi:hypothetical protein